MPALRDWLTSGAEPWHADDDIAFIAEGLHTAADTLHDCTTRPDIVTEGLVTFLRRLADTAHTHAALRSAQLAITMRTAP